MTNGEFYEKEIVEFVKDQGDNTYKAFCNEFISPKMLTEHGLECNDTNCSACDALLAIWLNKEYKEPETDWSKVEVDTPILVKLEDSDLWEKRYFAKYEKGVIYAFKFGLTSYTNNGALVAWDQSKLWEGSDEQRREAVNEEIRQRIERAGEQER